MRGSIPYVETMTMHAAALPRCRAEGGYMRTTVSWPLIELLPDLILSLEAAVKWRVIHLSVV